MRKKRVVLFLLMAVFLFEVSAASVFADSPDYETSIDFVIWDTEAKKVVSEVSEDNMNILDLNSNHCLL